MKEKRHSGIFQAFWPMKVEAKSAKLVIKEHRFRSYVKKNVQGTQLKSRGNGTECEY